jgi:hypothetical protein
LLPAAAGEAIKQMLRDMIRTTFEDALVYFFDKICGVVTDPPICNNPSRSGVTCVSRDEGTQRL